MHDDHNRSFRSESNTDLLPLFHLSGRGIDDAHVIEATDRMKKRRKGGNLVLIWLVQKQHDLLAWSGLQSRLHACHLALPTFPFFIFLDGAHGTSIAHSILPLPSLMDFSGKGQSEGSRLEDHGEGGRLAISLWRVGKTSLVGFPPFPFA